MPWPEPLERSPAELVQFKRWFQAAGVEADPLQPKFRVLDFFIGITQFVPQDKYGSDVASPGAPTLEWFLKPNTSRRLPLAVVHAAWQSIRRSHGPAVGSEVKR